MSDPFNLFMDEHFARGPHSLEIVLSGRTFRLYRCALNNHKPDPVPEGEDPGDSVLEIVYGYAEELESGAIHIEQYHIEEHGSESVSEIVAECGARGVLAPDGRTFPANYDFVLKKNPSGSTCIPCQRARFERGA